MANETSELSIISKSLTSCERRDVAKQIMTICSLITPQFYSNKSVAERKAERMSIELLTEGIEQEVLEVMCKMAVNQYPLERARNEKTFFDINYLLTFYEKAFNYYWCDSRKIDGTWNYNGGRFNQYTGILTEEWKKGEAKETIKFLVAKSKITASEKSGCYEDYHSPKYYKNLYCDIDELEL